MKTHTNSLHCILIIITTTTSSIYSFETFIHQYEDLFAPSHHLHLHNSNRRQQRLLDGFGRSGFEQQINLMEPSTSASSSQKSLPHFSAYFQPFSSLPIQSGLFPLPSQRRFWHNLSKMHVQTKPFSSHKNNPLHLHHDFGHSIDTEADASLTQEMRLLPPSSLFSSESRTSPAGVEMKEMKEGKDSSIPKVLKMMKNRIKSIPGIKAFLLKEFVKSSDSKPELMIASGDQFDRKPENAVWKYLKGKSSKQSVNQYRLGKSAPITQPSNNKIRNEFKSESSSARPVFLTEKYLSDALRTDLIDLSMFPDSSSIGSDPTLYGTSLDFGESSPQEVIELNGNRITSSSGVSQSDTLAKEKYSSQKAASVSESSSASQSAPQVEEEKDEDVDGKKLVHSQVIDPAMESIDEDPFPQNSHLPKQPRHNGWIPRDTKHWSPGAYRSAFYTPDTRLIRFTIRDRVSRKDAKKLQSTNHEEGKLPAKPEGSLSSDDVRSRSESSSIGDKLGHKTTSTPIRASL